MSQKRWIVELAFKDPFWGAPVESDWCPDDGLAGDWKDKQHALERACQLANRYNCFIRVRRTDAKTAPICHWPYNQDDMP